MKKITMYILIIVGICFLIPIFFTVKFVYFVYFQIGEKCIEYSEKLC